MYKLYPLGGLQIRVVNHINYTSQHRDHPINPTKPSPNTARARLQDVAITVMAILNDSTGTLMSCAHSSHNCRIGVIIGKTFRKFVPPPRLSSESFWGQFPCRKFAPLKESIDNSLRRAKIPNWFPTIFQLFPPQTHSWFLEQLSPPGQLLLFYVVVVSFLLSSHHLYEKNPSSK